MVCAAKYLLLEFEYGDDGDDGDDEGIRYVNMARGRGDPELELELDDEAIHDSTSRAAQK